MNARRRRGNSPYYVPDSPAGRVHSAARECRLARVGARELVRGSGASPAQVLKMSNSDTRAGRSIARALVGIGEDVAHRNELERKRQAAFRVPEANTSYGQHVEWMLVASKQETAISALLRLAMKAGNRKAVELLSMGKVSAGMREMVKGVG